MKNAEAIRQIIALQPVLRRTTSELARLRKEHPELFPPHCPPLFKEKS